MIAAITAYPFATVYGELEIPDNLSAEERSDYIREHFDDIEFGEPDLDYAGTDMDIEYEEELEKEQ